MDDENNEVMFDQGDQDANVAWLDEDIMIGMLCLQARLMSSHERSMQLYRIHNIEKY